MATKKRQPDTSLASRLIDGVYRFSFPFSPFFMNREGPFIQEEDMYVIQPLESR